MTEQNPEYRPDVLGEYLQALVALHTVTGPDRDPDLPSFTPERRAEIEELLDRQERSSTSFQAIDPTLRTQSRVRLMGLLETIYTEPVITKFVSKTEVEKLGNRWTEQHLNGTLPTEPQA